MSFVCDECKKSQPIGSKTNKIVVGKRNKSYENVRTNPNNDRTTTDLSEGWEIVRELTVCKDCYKLHTGLEGQQVAPVEEKPKFNQPKFQEKGRRDTFRPNNNQRNHRAPVVERIPSLKK